RLAANGIYRRAGAVLHQTKSQDKAHRPNDHQQQQGKWAIKAEKSFACFSRGNETDDCSPSSPRSAEEKTGQTKFSRDAAREDDGFKRVPQNDKKNREPRDENAGKRNHVRIVPVKSGATVMCLGFEFGGYSDFRFEEFGDGAAGFRGF